jgi:uncharacterized protein YndB with AHSA1/START domain
MVSDQEVLITRMFDAPRELVWKAMTDPAAIPQWWGPRRYTTMVDRMDVRVGGGYRFVQIGEDGSEHAFRGEYREVVPPERIVQTFEYEPYAGQISVETATLEEIDGRTKLTIRARYGSKEHADGMISSGMEEGMWETYERLDDYLAGMHNLVDLVITREFDAPVEMVWKAWSERDLFMQWWGPKIFTSPICEMDFREGGKYLFCMRDPDGKDYFTTGIYQEIDPQKKIVYTDSFADAEGNIVPASAYGMTGYFPEKLLVTVTFEDVNGKTKMTMTQLAHPAGEMFTGAQQGWNESFDKLAETLRG